MTITSSQLLSVSTKPDVTPAQNPWALVRSRLNRVGYGLTAKLEGGDRWITGVNFRLRVTVLSNGDLEFQSLLTNSPDEAQCVAQIVRSAYKEFHVIELRDRILSHLSVVSRPVSHLELVAMFSERYLDSAIELLRREGWISVGSGLGLHPTYLLAGGVA